MGFMFPGVAGRGFIAATVCAVLLPTISSSQADEFWPGIPDNDGWVADSWNAAASHAIGYSNLSKQWFRNPITMVTVRANGYQEAGVNPDGTPNVLDSVGRARAQAFMVSPPGAPEPYGYMEPVTVRSLGFGLVPVEATIRVSQRRRDGYPIPFRVEINTVWHGLPNNGGYKDIVVEPTVLEDAVNVELLAVKIDGQSIGLKPGCRTVTPAPIRVVGPGYVIDTPNDQRGWFDSHDPKTYFDVTSGGYMAGSITIPAFTGCVTASGDDISDLMTSSASGPGNPVEAYGSWVCNDILPTVAGQRWPLETGKNTPKRSGCDEVPPDLPYPDPPAP